MKAFTLQVPPVACLVLPINDDDEIPAGVGSMTVQLVNLVSLLSSVQVGSATAADVRPFSSRDWTPGKSDHEIISSV